MPVQELVFVTNLNITLISEVGPSSLCLKFQFKVLKTLTVPSRVPIAKNFPSRLNLTRSTVSVSLSRILIGVSGCYRLQINAISSPPPEAN